MALKYRDMELEPGKCDDFEIIISKKLTSMEGDWSLT